MDAKMLRPLKDYKNRSYFIKIPNTPESAVFLRVLRQHYKAPKYRVRVFTNGYGAGETLRNTRAWRIYIHEVYRTETNIDGKWWRNLDIREISSLREQVRELESKTSTGELEALAFIKKKYPEILMEYLLTK